MGSGSLVLSLVVWLAAVFPHVSAGALQNLDWTSPSPNFVYSPGDTIIGGWTSDKSIVSPSFSLCAESQDSEDGSAEDDCGETVWPSVEQNGDQSSFSLTAPKITSDSNFYLRMKDDFGNVNNSPTFSLSPSAAIAQSSSDSNVLGASSVGDTVDDERASDARDEGPSGSSTSSDDSAAQAPFSDSSGDTVDSLSSSIELGSGNKAHHTALGSDTSARVSQSTTAVAGPVSSASSQTSVPAGEPAGKPAKIPDSVGSGSSSPTDSAVVGMVLPQTDITSHAALPTAAVAVPLSLVAVTLLASVVLCLAHRRSLAAQRERNVHLIDMQRSTSAGSAYSKAPSAAGSLSKPASIADPDIEKAIGALYGYRSHLPPQAHVSKRDSVVYVPVAPPHYPVPRQDVRKERMRTYDRPYERSHDRECARSYTGYPSRRSSSRYRRYLQSPPEQYAHSLPEHYRRYSTRRDRYNRNDDCSEDEASTTDNILSGYISPEIATPRLPHIDPYLERPRAPPRTYSRHTAPEMDGYHYRRRDAYDPTSHAEAASPIARSHRSL